jgi:thiamine-phosphate pyrophosphorylase
MYNKTNLKDKMCIYAITDRAWLNGRTLQSQVEAAIKGGAGIIQLREKHMGKEDIIKEALEINKVCKKYNVPLIINDSVEVAVAIDADGVHLGQDDMDIQKARQLLGENKIIGVSAHNVPEAVNAWKNGADYLGSGAVFATGSKDNVTPLSHKELKNICKSVPIPVVAIGGISDINVTQLSDTGISGVAVISAIFAKADIEQATKDLYNIVKTLL